MKYKDKQTGGLYVLYKDTKTNIEALSNVEAGATAFATDTGEMGVYSGTSWVWGSGGGSSVNVVGTAFNGDAIPDNAGSISDEFDSDTMANWIELDFNNTTTWSIQNGYLRAQQSYNSNDNRSGLVKAIPSGDFTIETHVYLSTPYLKFRSAGLQLNQDLTGSGGIYVIDLCIENYDNQWLKTDVLRLNNYSSWNSTPAQLRIMQITDAYYRIARSGTTYHFMYSNNGIGWLDLYSTTLPFTPTYFGLSIANRGVSGGAIVAHFEYFRYWNTFFDITDTTMPPKQRINFVE